MDGPPWIRGGGGILAVAGVIGVTASVFILPPEAVRVLGIYIAIAGFFHIARAYNLNRPLYSDVPRWKWIIPFFIAVIQLLIGALVPVAIGLMWDPLWQTWLVVGAYSLDGLIWLWWGAFIGFSAPENQQYRWLYVIFGALEIILAMLTLAIFQPINNLYFNIAVVFSAASLTLYWVKAIGRT
jgi:hypothetical protein